MPAQGVKVFLVDKYDNTYHSTAVIPIGYDAWAIGDSNFWVVTIAQDQSSPQKGAVATYNDPMQPRLGATFAPVTPTIEQPVVPESITLFQARTALRIAGYLDAINAFMASDQATPEQKDAWEYSPVVPRGSETVAQLTAMLGLTSTEMDDLFILGDSISI